MNGIFISYRRDDTQGWAGRIEQGLRARFGEIPLFFDLEAIGPGQDFTIAIESALTSCRVLLALIGPRWLNVADTAGRRRIDNSHDYVRLEIVTALRRGVLVIPVLLGGANMPPDGELPDDLATLRRRNGHELTDKRWNYDFENLVVELARETGFTPRKTNEDIAASMFVQVGNDLKLDQTEAGDLAGIKTSGRITTKAERVEVASGAHIKRTKLGDIVGIKHEDEDKDN